MGFDLAQPAAAVAGLLVLAGCWPLAQALRNDKLHPVAAYLLFVSVLGLVSAAIFAVLLRGAMAFLGPAALESAGAAVAITLLSLAPGLAAARRVVRRPQRRRMPR